MERKRMASRYIELEEENEDLLDEVDLFHANDRKLSVNAFKTRTIKQQEEVLNVEGDSSINSEISDSDFDSDSAGKVDSVIENKWGRKRKDFYGTEYIDEDWGGMRDEELNEAELEEDDAVGRQAALDKSAAIAVDMLDVCAINAPQSIVKETAFEWKLSTIRKMNKRTAEIIEEYTRRKNLMRVLVAPLLPAIEKLPEKSVFRKQLMLVFDIYVTYIMNMLFFLRLKADSLAKKNAVDKVLDSHPVLGKIEKFAEMIRIADAFVDKNSAALKKLNKKVSLGESIDALIVEPQVSRPCQVKSENHEISIEEDQPKTSDHLSIEDRRKASKKIEKNTIVPFRRRKKKDPRIAKTKNRKRYKEAVKKVHSQIGTIRKEIQKYTGESRGIRISTVKSTKLIA